MPAVIDVLYEDNHLLVVNKPVGLPTMGVAADRPSLWVAAKEYLKQKYQKPGNVYLGTVSRIDSPVSGVMLFARTSKAAARVSEQIRAHTVEKIYWALIQGRIKPSEGECLDWLKEDERHRCVQLVPSDTPGAKPCRLTYRTLANLERISHLEVLLDTGRKHQIRVQFARRGHAILGDRKYGAKRPFAAGIALHARTMRLLHPVGGQPIEFTAPPPGPWRGFVGEV